jgi:prepilin-type N-terminal cleavage/methylation domain-containing protein
MKIGVNKVGKRVDVRWEDEAFDCAVVAARIGDRDVVAPCQNSSTQARHRIPLLKRSARCRRAFSLVEILIVIGIIGVLAALMLTALPKAQERGKISVARMEMASLRMAIIGYYNAYGRFPMPSTSISGDFTFGPSGMGSTAGTYTANNSEVMAILMDMDRLSNAKHAVNPRKLSFFTAQHTSYTNAHGLGPDFVLRDPWGNPYIISIDFDYNNRCEDAVYGNAVVSADPANSTAGYNGLVRTPPSNVYECPGQIMIWSMGPDGQASTTVPANAGVNKDNVLSWTK